MANCKHKEQNNSINNVVNIWVTNVATPQVFFKNVTVASPLIPIGFQRETGNNLHLDLRKFFLEAVNTCGDASKQVHYGNLMPFLLQIGRIPDTLDYIVWWLLFPPFFFSLNTSEFQNWKDFFVFLSRNLNITAWYTWVLLFCYYVSNVFL